MAGEKLQRWGRAKWWRAMCGLLVMTTVAVAGLPAEAAPKDKSPVIDLATGEPVAAAFSKLDRGDDAIATTVRTRGVPGHAYTLWYAIFNAPEHCSDAACGADDVFNDGDHSAGLNVTQIRATRASVLWAQDGAVANPAGRLALDGRLAVGEVPDGDSQVVIGRGEDGALAPVGVVTGLENGDGAVVWAILLDHGVAHDDPDLLASQLTAFEGACNPDCVETQAAQHAP